MGCDDFDDSETPPPRLFYEANQDPRARDWADREMRYVQEIATLKAELAGLRFKLAAEINEKAKLALELNRIRRAVYPAKKKG